MDELVPAPRVLADFRAATTARIALGRTGAAIRTRDQLRFQMDHAAARDAVHTMMDIPVIVRGLLGRGLQPLVLDSAAAEGPPVDRSVYLQRPDLGRRLSAAAALELRDAAARLPAAPEIVVVIADGLSSVAVERQSVALIDRLLPWSGSLAVALVRNGRVAVGDEIGEVLAAAFSVVLIGERPGLSAHDSMGVYVTAAPRFGRTDAERLCISNVRPGGLTPAKAADRLHQMIHTARRTGRTGVTLPGSGSMLGTGG